MYDDVKERLKAFKSARLRYESLRLQLEECEAMLTSISIDYSREKVQSTPELDKLAAAMDRLSRLRLECIKQAHEAVRTMEDAKALIDTVEQGQLHELLTRRYIRGQTWEVIAVEMHYSWRGVHKMHLRALGAVKSA